MGVQLVRIGFGTDYVQIFGSVCRSEKVPYCQRGIVSVQEHVSICERWIVGKCHQRISANGWRENGKCQRAISAGGGWYWWSW